MPLPLAAVLGISSGAGALANLFGSKDPKQFTIDDLKKFGYKGFDEQKATDDIKGLEANRIQDIRAESEKVAAATGGENNGPSYSNERGVYQATDTALANVKQAGVQEGNRVAAMLAQLNSGQPQAESGFSKILSGGLQGANIGLKLHNVLTPPGTPGLPGTIPGGTNPVPNSPGNIPQLPENTGDTGNTDFTFGDNPTDNINDNTGNSNPIEDFFGNLTPDKLQLLMQMYEKNKGKLSFLPGY